VKVKLSDDGEQAALLEQAAYVASLS
jgi:hypothetical protein